MTPSTDSGRLFGVGEEVAFSGKLLLKVPLEELTEYICVERSMWVPKPVRMGHRDFDGFLRVEDESAVILLSA